jgi:hypothetical protein
MLLMFQNALMYNREGTSMYRFAMEMKSFAEERIAAFRQTEQLVKKNTSDQPSTRKKGSLDV